MIFITQISLIYRIHKEYAFHFGHRRFGDKLFLREAEMNRHYHRKPQDFPPAGTVGFLAYGHGLPKKKGNHTGKYRRSGLSGKKKNEWNAPKGRFGERLAAVPH